MNASEFMFLDAPNCRLELRRGVICEREFLGAAGGSATCRLLCALTAPYLEDTSVTVLAGGTGFLIEQTPDTVIAPNGAVFVHRDLSSCPEDEYLTVPPDIVLETWTPPAVMFCLASLCRYTGYFAMQSENALELAYR